MNFLTSCDDIQALTPKHRAVSSPAVALDNLISPPLQRFSAAKAKGTPSVVESLLFANLSFVVSGLKEDAR
jgi:hypothetical protein